MASAADLSVEALAAIAAGVALIPASASAVWARAQSRSAKASAKAANIGAKAAETQAGLAKDAVKVAAAQLDSSRGVALGQLLLTLDQLLGQYLSVHTRLHPRSPNPPWSVSNPPTASDQIAIEMYMGLLERVYVLIQLKIVPADVARRFYGYRVKNVVRNEWIRDKKLQGHASGWQDFLKLCDELEVEIPGSRRAL